MSLVFAFISSLIPNFSKMRRMFAPVAPVPTYAIDFEASSARLNESAVAMSGFGAPFFIATPAPALSDRRTRLGRDLALLREIVDQRGREDGDVERLAFFDPRFEVGRRREMEHELVLRRLLELRSELLQHRFDAVRAEYLDLRGLSRETERECESQGAQC